MAEMCEEIRVLYVDDNAALRDLTAELLEKVSPSITILTESDPESVQAQITAESIDCVVSDYQMPGYDGLELLEDVRAEFENLPFFVFTSNGDRAVIEAALDAGATDFIEKATGIEHYKLLANRITNAVRHHRDRQRIAELEAQS